MGLVSTSLHRSQPLTDISKGLRVWHFPRRSNSVPGTFLTKDHAVPSKALVAKSNNVSSIPRTHRVEGAIQLTQAIF